MLKYKIYIMDQETSSDQNNKDDKPLPIWVLLIYPIFLIFVLGLFLFPISRWAWDWWEAWVVLGVMGVLIGAGFILINLKNPRTLRNRMKIKKEGLTKETKKSARSDLFVFPIMIVGFFGSFVYPAVEKRFEGSWGVYPYPIPWWIEIIGMLVMTIGWVIVIAAQVQNAYASKILDINKEQKLIDTGLYSKIRHPLYSGVCLWSIGIPLSLGSVVALVGSIIIFLSLVIRIKFEEDMLIKGMDGYDDYKKRVKYKLIPGIY